MFFKILFRLTLFLGLWATGWLIGTFAFQAQVKEAILVGVVYWSFGFLALTFIWFLPAVKKAKANEDQHWLFWIVGLIGIAVAAMLWPYWVLDPFDEWVERTKKWLKEEQAEENRKLF